MTCSPRSASDSVASATVGSDGTARHNRSRRSCTSERRARLNCGRPANVIFGVFDRTNTPSQPCMTDHRPLPSGFRTQSGRRYFSLRGPLQAWTAGFIRSTWNGSETDTASHQENRTTAPEYEDSITLSLKGDHATTARIGGQQYRTTAEWGSRTNRRFGGTATCWSLLTFFAERITDYARTLERSFSRRTPIIHSKEVVPAMKRQLSRRSRRGQYRSTDQLPGVGPNSAESSSSPSRTSQNGQKRSLNHLSCIVPGKTNAPSGGGV